MLMQMALETKSGLEAGVIGGGHGVAASRLDAQRSVSGWASEQMGGLSYLFFIRDLVRFSVFPFSCAATVSQAMDRCPLVRDLVCNSNLPSFCAAATPYAVGRCVSNRELV